MSDIKLLIRNDNGVLYFVGASQQVDIHVVHSDDLETVEDEDGKSSLLSATTHVFLQPEQIVRGDFDKFISNYINDEL